MASSLLSLALDQPLDPTVAMTGELTLTGKILRIGGLREKTVAARRAGAKTVIFPADNMSDWLELPEVFNPICVSFPGSSADGWMVVQNIKEGIQGHAASWYADVFDLVFPNLDIEAANQRWKSQLAKAVSESAKVDD